MNRIITISREFGSGGRTIGRLTAKNLGIPRYDAEIIQKIAAESGYAESYLKEDSEDTPGGWLGAVLANRQAGPTNQDLIWQIQCKVILDLAEKGPCVIVGRCADYILRDREDCLHTFIHADKAKRAERIVRVYGESEKSPETRLDDKDSRRAVNYKHFTGRDWGRCENYHLSLDSGALGIDTCVKLICDLAEKK